MSDPLAAIAAEGTAQAAVASVAPASWFAGAWSRLTSPSPRDMGTLSADSFALLINGGLDKRSMGAASESKVGEGVMDCVYAFMSGTTAGGSSPLGRLLSAVVGFVARLKSRQPEAPTA